jgi:hypothetical protein
MPRGDPERGGEMDGRMKEKAEATANWLDTLETQGGGVIRDLLAALATAERERQQAEKRLAGVLTLIWEIDRHGEDRSDAVRRFRRLRRAVQGEGYPFTDALAAALPGEGEGR